jgi:hypothetical protein
MRLQMEEAKENKKLNDIAFYSLMGILSLAVLFTLGFLVYSLFA